MSRRMGFLPRKLTYSSSSSAALLLSNKKTALSVANEEGEDGDGEKKDEEEEGKEEDERWSRMLPEILIEIARRLDEGEGSQWPARRSVVAFGCTCRRWREVALDVVKPPTLSGKITFPISLKQPGPRDKCFQCFIRRDRRNATYYLYLCLSNAWVDNGKLLMAARRSRRGAHIEYVISLDADDLSQGSNAYMGKLRSDFLGINFTIFDSQPPFDGAKAAHNRSSRRFTSKQISPQVPAGNFEIGHVSYKFNLLRSRGPRRMVCKFPYPMAKQAAPVDTLRELKVGGTVVGAGNVVLKNKAPRWHEHLQCWCLNFHGRVTVASVKNFQLVVAADPRRPSDDETILQFGKVDDDTFTMDYRDPLSAFQAFAICLTSFGTKPACE